MSHKPNKRETFIFKRKTAKKNVSLSRAVAVRRISDLLPLFCFFYVFFVFRSVFNT